jgi:hypothetical protein
MIAKAIAMQMPPTRASPVSPMRRSNNLAVRL